MLPTLTKLLGDSQAEVRQAAGESLVGVAGLMKPMDLGQHVLTIVLQLAHDDEQVSVVMYRQADAVIVVCGKGCCGCDGCGDVHMLSGFCLPIS